MQLSSQYSLVYLILIPLNCFYIALLILQSSPSPHPPEYQMARHEQHKYFYQIPEYQIPINESPLPIPSPTQSHKWRTQWSVEIIVVDGCLDYSKGIDDTVHIISVHA